MIFPIRADNHLEMSPGTPTPTPMLAHLWAPTKAINTCDSCFLSGCILKRGSKCY